MIAILEKTEHNIDFHQIVDFIEASYIRVYNFSKMIFDGMGEGSAIPTEPYHTPSPQEQHSSHHDTSSSSHPTTTTEPIPQIPIETPTETPTLSQYSRRATRIAQSKSLSSAVDEPASLLRDDNQGEAFSTSKSLSSAVDEPASLLRDDSQGEAFSTVTSLDARQDRENIIKTSALPHDSSPRVTSLDADEGNMQQQLQELMDLCTSLQRQQTQMAAKIKDQNLEISGLKAKVKILKDKDRGREEPAQEDAPIKGGSMEIGKEVRVERSTKLGSNDTEEMVNVLSAMEAANILTGGVAAVSVSPVAAATTVGVPTVKILKDKDRGREEPAQEDAPIKGGSMEIGKEVRVERSTKLGSNDTEEMVNVLSAMEAANILTGGVAAVSVSPVAAATTVGEKVVESDVPKKKKLQEQIDAQVGREMEEEFARDNQRLSEQLARDSKIARLHAEEELKMMIEGLDRSNEMIAKHLHEYEQAAVDLSIREKIELINELLDQGSSKRMKTSEDVSEEDVKGMMQLVPMEEVYVEALQVKNPIIDWEIHSEGKKDY
nr:hypothetical protein [Tanacetum cinerariifolium]